MDRKIVGDKSLVVNFATENIVLDADEDALAEGAAGVAVPTAGGVNSTGSSTAGAPGAVSVSQKIDMIKAKLESMRAKKRKVASGAGL